MIQSNEIRLRNFLNYTGIGNDDYPAGIVEVEEVLQEGINLSHGDDTIYEYEKLEGIPLSPEILEKCGFVEKYNHNSDGDEVNWMEYQRKDVIGNNYLCYKDGQINLFHGQLNITPCKFVHDLQNLYFALTGEELTVLL